MHRKGIQEPKASVVRRMCCERRAGGEATPLPVMIEDTQCVIMIGRPDGDRISHTSHYSMFREICVPVSGCPFNLKSQNSADEGNNFFKITKDLLKTKANAKSEQRQPRRRLAEVPAIVMNQSIDTSSSI